MPDWFQKLVESDIYPPSHDIIVSRVVKKLITTAFIHLLFVVILFSFMDSKAENHLFPDDWITISLENSRDIEFSPDGSLLAMGFQNGTVVGYNISSQDIDWIIKENHTIQALEWAYNDDDLILAVGMGAWNNTNKGGLRIYSIPDLHLIEDSHFNEWISCLSYDPFHNRLAVSGQHYGDLDVLDASDWTLIDNIPTGYVLSIDFSEKGEELALSYYEFIELDGKPYRSEVEIYRLDNDQLTFNKTIGPVPVIASYLEWRPKSSQLVFGNETMYLGDSSNGTFSIIKDNLGAMTTGACDNTGQIFYYSQNFIIWALDIDQGSQNHQFAAGNYIVDIEIFLDNSMLAIAEKESIKIGEMNFSYTPAPKDSDGDGYPDSSDKFPDDPTEWNDTDDDGYGDNTDRFPKDPAEWNDTDNDGYGDNSDAFPEDPFEWNDTDNDGYGDNSDRFPEDPSEWMDSDNDTFGDNSDEFPNDPTEWKDTDGDGVGNNSDAFPENASEWIDSDGDGVGDNTDEFPFDPWEWKDSDGDGEGDGSDPYPYDPTRKSDGEPLPNATKDSDNDTVPDDEDKFPNDPAASVDDDMDGYPDMWNPGMTAEDSTTGLELDRYLNDPRDQSRKDPDKFSIDTWVLVPIIIFTLVILFLVAVLVIVRSIGKRTGDLTIEEERIKRYIEDITGTGENGEMEIDDHRIRVLLEDSRFEGRISDSTYRSIMDILN